MVRAAPHTHKEARSRQLPKVYGMTPDTRADILVGKNNVK